MKLLSIVLFLVILGYVSADVSNIALDATLWDNVLKRWVTENVTIDGISVNAVDYTGISKDSEFSQYITQLEFANTTGLTSEETYAFFINVYNALAVNMIANHPCGHDIFGKCGPLRSIRDIGNFPFSQVWNKEAGKVAGKTWTLDEVEGFLRKPTGMKEDPRLHSAIVCASVSCPNLRPEAYRADILDYQLTDNFNNFLLNTKKGMSVSKGRLTLSPIFNWFSEDFVSFVRPNNTKATVVDFILLYLSPSNPNYQFVMEHRGKTLEFFNYDWNVNSKSLPCDSKKRPCFTLLYLLITLGVITIIGFALGLAICIVRRKRRSNYVALN